MPRTNKTIDKKNEKNTVSDITYEAVKSAIKLRFNSCCLEIENALKRELDVNKKRELANNMITDPSKEKYKIVSEEEILAKYIKLTDDLYALLFKSFLEYINALVEYKEFNKERDAEKAMTLYTALDESAAKFSRQIVFLEENYFLLLKRMDVEFVNKLRKIEIELKGILIENKEKLKDVLSLDKTNNKVEKVGLMINRDPNHKFKTEIDKRRQLQEDNETNEIGRRM